MTGINARALDRELKRGSAELLILSLLDARPRHGYELSKLIDARSGGQLTFHIDSLYPLLYRLEERGWIKAVGSRRPASGAAGFTRSPPKGGACLPSKRDMGGGPMDPLTYAVVSGALAAVALLATYLPARRASRVDPTVALRADV
jgi:PadR family transcriptional regulator PadR